MRKQDSNKCDICGKDAIIHISDGKGGHEAHYCQTCHNRLMTEEMGIEAPEDVPEELIIVDSKDQVHRFKIEYLNWGHMQRLEAFGFIRRAIAALSARNSTSVSRIGIHYKHNIPIM